jgi:hypothetical protein
MSEGATSMTSSESKTMVVDFPKAKIQLRRIVDAKGEDYVYPRQEACVYFEKDGSPSCIIGHELAKHGITRDDLLVEDIDYNDENSVEQLVEAGFIKTDPATREFLLEVQAFQDAGAPWGVALSEAIVRHKDRQAGVKNQLKRHLRAQQLRRIWAEARHG